MKRKIESRPVALSMSPMGAARGPGFATMND
jgi:hypothetical protein